MRSHKDYIEELSYIIEVDGEVVGGIFYTYAWIVTPDNKKEKVVSFGPVFITPKLHRIGLARKIITHTIELAKEMGYRAIVTGGYPYHYETYGFRGGKKYGISMADGKFYTGLLVLP